jgi:chromosome segregation protein
MDGSLIYNSIDQIQTFTGSRTRKNNLKPSKSYSLLPCLKKHGNKLFSKKGSELLTNQQFNDSDNLKTQLINCKAKMYEQNRIYLNLKIKYGKLYNENWINKNLISDILGVPLNKKITKEEVLDKIENAKMNNFNRELLNEALKAILLKSQIEEKKELNKEKEKYLKELEENSKTKKINQLMKDFMSKCEEQRSLLRILKTLTNKNNSLEEELKKLKDNFENDKNTKKNNTKKIEVNKIKYANLIFEREEINKENKFLEEKIKKTILSYREKDNQNILTELAINDMKEEVDELDFYKKERDGKLKQLEEKKDIIEDLRKKRKELEDNINQLYLEKDNLDDKMDEYNNEKPKLLRKSKESKSDIDKKKQLEKELLELKNIKTKTTKIHEEKKRQLKEKEDKEKQEIEKNEEMLGVNNKKKDELNHIINELRTKNISLIKKNLDIFNKKNKLLKEENNTNQQEINEWDNELKNWNDIEDQLKKAEGKLKHLKKNKK